MLDVYGVFPLTVKHRAFRKREATFSNGMYTSSAGQKVNSYKLKFAYAAVGSLHLLRHQTIYNLQMIFLFILFPPNNYFLNNSLKFNIMKKRSILILVSYIECSLSNLIFCELIFEAVL